jgi:pyrimidine-nucleoside phosphorylase
MVVLAGKAKDAAAGRALCEEALASGLPRKLFLDNVRSQGGDPDKLLALRGTYRSPHQAAVTAAQSGYLARIDAWKVGIAGVSLGVGRNRTEDAVSPVAGVRFHKKGGEAVALGETVMTVWGKDAASLETALPLLRDALEYSDTPRSPRRLVLKEIASK